MKLNYIRRRRRQSRWVEGIFSKNPVLMCGLALPFAVMVTDNLKNAAAISIFMACSLIPTVLLCALVGRLPIPWLSPILCAAVSLSLVIAAIPLVTPISAEVLDALGIYAPILAVNSLGLHLCQRQEEKRSPALALADAFSYSAGFALALCLIASVRELLTFNTLWGIPIALPFKVGAVQIAFAGFILTGMFGALFQALRRVYMMLVYRHENPVTEREVDIV